MSHKKDKRARRQARQIKRNPHGAGRHLFARQPERRQQH